MKPLSNHHHLNEDDTEQLTDYRYHLELSQKMAKVGSWELDLTKDDPDALQYWSDETYRILGYEPGEIRPSFNSFINSIHPEDRSEVMSAAQASIKEGKDYNLEQRHVLPDGRIITTKSIARVVRDDQTGLPIKLCGAMRDITERIEMNTALERADREMSIFFETIDEVLYSVNMQEYKILQMSPACEKVYGYTVDDFLRNNYLWMDVILEEDKQIIYNSDPIMQRGEVVSNEYRIRHKDGGIRWLGGTLTPTLDEDGNLLRIDGVVSDITARKEAEIALKNSEQRFRTLLENSSDGIIVTAKDRTLLFASSSMSRITGYSAGELVYIDINRLFHPDDQNSLIEARNKLLETPGNRMHFKARLRKKDGNWIWLEGTSQNLLHEDSVEGLVTNFRDITERIDSEEALSSAIKHLEKTNSELDRFVYSVSHDLRAPLASVLGVIEFTELETQESGVLESLSMIKQSVKKLDRFILDILDYSRNSRMEVRNERIDFKQLLNEIENNLKYMSRDSGNVCIRTRFIGNHDFYSDSNRLGIILNNLISNSLRYFNPEVNNPYVELSVETTSNEAIIVIKDNGVGIDKELHGKIFDMFYRISKTSVGSGLGLYIVKETIEKLNGFLQLDSIPGTGTEIKLRIPNTINHTA